MRRSDIDSNQSCQRLHATDQMQMLALAGAVIEYQWVSSGGQLLNQPTGLQSRQIMACGIRREVAVYPRVRTRGHL